MPTRRLVIVLGVLLARLASAQAVDLEIRSFDTSGRLTFNEVTNAARYRVDWTTNLRETVWSTSAPPGVAGILALGAGNRAVTVGVQRVESFYRVVASFPDAPTGTPVGMVLIPAGINAGTDPDMGSYSLTVNAFYLDRYEVTMALWGDVHSWATNHGYAFDNAGSGKATNHPVHTLNWYDAVKWCNARSEKEWRTPCYYTEASKTTVYRTGVAGMSNEWVNESASGYRLPTDVEWEYAARGGVVGHRFPWSDEDTITHIRANYLSDEVYSYDVSASRGYHPTYTSGGMPYTSPVGEFAPNGYGVYDLAGNVWEWCWDWYPGFEGSCRMFRGGSWDNTADRARIAFRICDSPGYGYWSFGFRTAMSAGQ